ncbi:MAG: hypothetical protein ACLR2G_01175 [Phascolarctobacterium faecium]
MQGYLTVATTVAKSYDVKLEGVRYNGGAQQGTGDTPMPGWMKALIAVGLIVLVIVDHMFFGGIITPVHPARTFARRRTRRRWRRFRRRLRRRRRFQQALVKQK